MLGTRLPLASIFEIVPLPTVFIRDLLWQFREKGLLVIGPVAPSLQCAYQYEHLGIYVGCAIGFVTEISKRRSLVVHLLKDPFRKPAAHQ